MTFGAKAALFKAAGGVGTEGRDRAVEAVGAVIKRFSETAGFLELYMRANLF